MTEASGFFLGLAFLLAALDWIAVARNVSPLEYLCKPAAAAAFLATAVALHPASDPARAWRCIALAFCVLGDVMLMQPRDAFVAGLAAFAVAQVAFTTSFAFQDPTLAGLGVGIVLVLPCVLLLAHRFLDALVSGGKAAMVPPVVVYMIVIGAMAVSAIATGNGFGIAGALLFLASDALIAEHRFVEARPWQPVTIMVTYHFALAGLVLGLL